MRDQLRNWDDVLPQTGFAFNSSFNCTIGDSPFEVAYGLKPKQPIDLTKLPPLFRTSQEGDAFARHIQEIHDKVRDKIKINHEHYKIIAPKILEYIKPCFVSKHNK